MVTDVLDSIEPGVFTKIIFVLQGRSNNNVNVRLTEFRINNKEVALRIRKYFATKKEQARIREDSTSQAVSL